MVDKSKPVAELIKVVSRGAATPGDRDIYLITKLYKETLKKKLAEYSNENKPEQLTVFEWFRSICEGMAEVHSKSTNCST